MAYFSHKCKHLGCKLQCIACFLSQQRIKLSTNIKIKTLAFLDTETTGLPFAESNRTRITELTITAVQSDHIALGVYPRVQNKINLCFNPRKLISAGAEKLTGLSNNLLETQESFDSNSVELIKHFLNRQPRPICFVAHNGKFFDYPILRAEILKTNMDFLEDILCVDSLEAFREFHLEDNSRLTDTPTSFNTIPIEFQDGYDKLLFNAIEDIELQSKLPISEPSNEKHALDDVKEGMHCNASSINSTKRIKGNSEATLDCLKLSTNEVRQSASINSSSVFIDEVLTQENASATSIVAEQNISGTLLKNGSDIQKINETTPKKPRLEINVLEKAVKEPVKSDESRGRKARRHLDFGVSFKLGDIFQRTTREPVVDAHKSECDVDMLIKIVATLGERFVNWANENAVKFCDIPPMKPGKKIGT